MELFTTVFLESLPMAIVGYCISLSLAKVFANKIGYKVNGSQELLAQVWKQKPIFVLDLIQSTFSESDAQFAYAEWLFQWSPYPEHLVFQSNWYMDDGPKKSVSKQLNYFPVNALLTLYQYDALIFLSNNLPGVAHLKIYRLQVWVEFRQLSLKKSIACCRVQPL